MISAGETSGDLHGASLALAASRLAPNLKFYGLGGDLMAEAGVELAAHLSETAVMGLTEVLGSLRRVLKVRKKMASLLAETRPAALVLIDSPDFNFFLAKKASQLKIPVIYYICPQVWAWRTGRLKFLARRCARRALIFPFEKDFYERRGVQADLVGHPLLDRLSPPPRPQARVALGFSQDRPLLALLPGSRESLAKRLAPPMLAAAGLLLERVPGLQLALPLAQTLKPAALSRCLAEAPEAVRQSLKVLPGQSQIALAAADGALLASGTSTVEGALLGVPMVVAYKTSALTYALARLLAKVPYVAIANLLMGRAIVPELIQGQATPRLMAEKALPFLTPGPAREKALADLRAAAAKLGGPGASARVLSLILEEIGQAQSGRKINPQVKGAETSLAEADPAQADPAQPNSAQPNPAARGPRETKSLWTASERSLRVRLAATTGASR
ncbi:MAG: lipid-A-disaccharide synthase [Deltaproteobacteria bacterium]|jgi:lipid-A-disaccharide synthase|nr:lipid-A-disaccharide synthase [Deltaproteobacteria bacterium]